MPSSAAVRPGGRYGGRAVLACLALCACGANGAPPPADATHPAPRTVAFACEDGSRLTVHFAGGAASATDAHGRAVRLVQQESGSGILYEGDSYTLRGKGEAIDWTAADGTTLACSASASPLTGSRWEIVAFRSADGRTETPEHPYRYVMELIVGGRLALQLDCNRASGRWEASATGPAGGAISLDAAAMTRAMCLGGSWDTRLAHDLLGARAYSLAGDRLTVTLADNRGAYVWRRLPPP